MGDWTIQRYKLCRVIYFSSCFFTPFLSFIWISCSSNYSRVQLVQTSVQVEQFLSQLPISIHHILNPLCFVCKGYIIKIGESKFIFYHTRKGDGFCLLMCEERRNDKSCPPPSLLLFLFTPRLLFSRSSCLLSVPLQICFANVRLLCRASMLQFSSSCLLMSFCAYLFSN